MTSNAYRNVMNGNLFEEVVLLYQRRVLVVIVFITKTITTAGSHILLSTF